MSVQYIINISAGGSITGIKPVVIPSSMLPTSVATSGSNNKWKDLSMGRLSSDVMDSSDLFLCNSSPVSNTHGLTGPTKFSDCMLPSPVYSDESSDLVGPMMLSPAEDGSAMSPSTLSTQSYEHGLSPSSVSFLGSPDCAEDPALDDWLFPTGLPAAPEGGDFGDCMLLEQTVLTDKDYADIPDSVLDGNLFNDEDFQEMNLLFGTAEPDAPACSPSPEEDPEEDDVDMFNDMFPQSYMELDDCSEFSLLDDVEDIGPMPKRRRVEGRSMSDEERKERKKESNRNAAFRYRQKMKAKAVEGECDLSSSVHQLQDVAASLKESRQTLDLMMNLAAEVIAERKRKRRL